MQPLLAQDEAQDMLSLALTMLAGVVAAAVAVAVNATPQANVAANPITVTIFLSMSIIPQLKFKNIINLLPLLY